jgi:alkanesulfonate monooxygenase SsuD/methylene tetrahydromethanopterin reductase-like flavin-dependent oxidoreductase (luciferase family)
MQVGLQLVCQNFQKIPDAEAFRQEMKLALEAEAMGFDVIGVVEHHFADYAMCPDNTQFLSYIAAKTKRIKLMTAAIILPWNDPLRVVEKCIMLDILSDGRLHVGFGRGLSPLEFGGFRVDMANSREMFDEAAEMIARGLETGIVEGNGKFFKQPRYEVRPRPEKSFKDRICMVGMSPSSVEIAGKLGFGTLKFSNVSWVDAMPEVDLYRKVFKQYQGKEAPPLIINDFLVCFNDAKKTKEFTDKYFRKYYESVLEHYMLGGDHLKKIPSYANYVEQGKKAMERGLDKAYQDYIGANLIGSPEEIWEHHLERKEIVGDYDVTINVSYGGMDYADSMEQLKLFADKLLPKFKAS